MNYFIVLFLRHVQRLYHFSKVHLTTANLIVRDSNPHLIFFSPLKL